MNFARCQCIKIHNNRGKNEVAEYFIFQLPIFKLNSQNWTY